MFTYFVRLGSTFYLHTYNIYKSKWSKSTTYVIKIIIYWFIFGHKKFLLNLFRGLYYKTFYSEIKTMQQ
jgi:hypothetical protein